MLFSVSDCLFLHFFFGFSLCYYLQKRAMKSDFYWLHFAKKKGVYDSFLSD